MAQNDKAKIADADALFGPADSGVDFFNFGQEAAHSGPNGIASPNPNDKNIQESDSSAISDLFAAGPDQNQVTAPVDNASYFPSGAAYASPNGHSVHLQPSIANGSPAVAGYDSYASDQNYSYNTTSAAQDYSNDYADAGWYDEDGQYHPYEDTVPSTDWNSRMPSLQVFARHYINTYLVEQHSQQRLRHKPIHIHLQRIRTIRRQRLTHPATHNMHHPPLFRNLTRLPITLLMILRSNRQIRNHRRPQLG